MKNVPAVLGTAVTALTLGLATLGCSSGTATDEKPAAETTSPAQAAPVPSAETSTPAAQPAAGQTLDDYLKEKNIDKMPVGRGDPGSPQVDLPVPQGWEATTKSTDASYGGIVYKQAVSPGDPPRITANLFKLTGDVDPAKVLELAPASLKSIAGFQSLGDSNEDELGGFQATQAGGGYTKDGNLRLIAQKTAVIPTDGGVFVLQLTADGLESDARLLMEATSAIDKETTITP